MYYYAFLQSLEINVQAHGNEYTNTGILDNGIPLQYHIFDFIRNVPGF